MLKSGRGPAFALLAMVAMTAAGCGSKHFKNEPRAATPIQLTGVIRASKVTVSPNRLGAGPIVLTISNQTKQAHTITLSGAGGQQQSTVGPVNPLDTAQIEQTLKRGTYTVKAGSPKAVAHGIKPATLSIGGPRHDSSNTLLMP